MPARRFFALLAEGRKQRRIERAAEHVALCDIASIGLGDSKYFEEIRKVFLTRAMGLEGEKRAAMDPTDPKTVALIEGVTMTAARLRQ